MQLIRHDKNAKVQSVHSLNQSQPEPSQREAAHPANQGKACGINVAAAERGGKRHYDALPVQLHSFQTVRGASGSPTERYCSGSTTGKGELDLRPLITPTAFTAARDWKQLEAAKRCSAMYSSGSNQRWMKCALLLTLIITQGWTTGHCDHHNKTYPDHNRYPCLRAPDAKAYKTFLIRHLLVEHFDVSNESAWASYLIKWRLCGRTGQNPQSFFQVEDQRNVVNLCNGQSIRQHDNVCKSIRTFNVFLIDSESLDRTCKILEIKLYHSVYVQVACDLISVVCVPVHYEGQDEIAPNPAGERCERRI
ncbi:hypothetical protein NFI96_009277 [Prochilodus magdalenae]|nr:hypothetical protein NFI96_009277 [Prochilodus magdalenae]